MNHLIVLPRTLRLATLMGFLPLGINVTRFKCVFIATSTPVMVPMMTVPFLSSILTVSFVSFIRNLYYLKVSVQQSENLMCSCNDCWHMIIKPIALLKCHTIFKALMNPIAAHLTSFTMFQMWSRSVLNTGLQLFTQGWAGKDLDHRMSVNQTYKCGRCPGAEYSDSERQPSTLAPIKRKM